LVCIFKSTSQKQLERAIPRLENFFLYNQNLLSSGNTSSTANTATNTAANVQTPSKPQSYIKLSFPDLALSFGKDSAPTATTSTASKKPFTFQEKLHIIKHALNVLDKAKYALQVGDVPVAWANYYDAQLHSFQFLNDAELQANAKNVFNDSEARLSDSEKSIVRSLIGKAEGGNWSCQENCSFEAVSNANKVIQKYNANSYTHLELARRPLFTLIAVAAVLIAIIVYTLTANPATITATSFSADGFNASVVNATDFNAAGFNASNVAAQNVVIEPVDNLLLVLVSVAAFGALGATASGLLTVSKDTLIGDIPTRLLNTSVIMTKPVFGALAGLAIYVFLIAGLFQIAGVAITNYLVFAVCFFAGYSEKYFLGAIEKADQTKTET
jgi:hypothetical protein